MVTLILFLESEMKKYSLSFKYINEFALYLNEITRLLPNFPTLVSSFRLNRQNEYSGIICSDHIVFSNLLYLLELDHLIPRANFEYMKYIRRSLIVYLSFDEVNDSNYLENETHLVELLIDKLCNYYQMLPSSFDLVDDSPTLEIGCNMNLTFQCLLDVYFDFKSYFVFLNKIANCLRSNNLKNKFRVYLFNKFYLKNVQSKLLSYNQKVSRTNFQYLISILRDATNSEFIDVTSYFLFGFHDQKTARTFDSKNIFEFNNETNSQQIQQINEKVSLDSFNKVDYYADIKEFEMDESDNYDHEHHLVSKLSSRILNSLTNKSENLNIIIIELFEIFFIKRPYMMIHKFIKPYVDFCQKQSMLTASPITQQNINKKKYPIITSLYELLNIYMKYNSESFTTHVESNMYKNYSYYINYDIDFYCYYIAERERMEELDMISVNEKYQEVDDGDLLLESINVINKTPKTNLSNSNNDSGVIYNKKFSEYNGEIVLDDKLFDEIEEIKEEFENMNYLLMKNIQLKLMNYFNNSVNENIFLTNLILTIISVPCLNFDPALLECNSVILDDNVKSKYSLLTVIRFLSQELMKIMKSNNNFDKFFKRKINEINKEEQAINKSANAPHYKKKQRKYSIDKAKNEITRQFKFDSSSLEKDYQDKEKNYTNYFIFFEFVKEFVSSISHKHKFEGVVEDVYTFYSNSLDDYYNNTSEIGSVKES